jgi:hypothetical protein
MDSTGIASKEKKSPGNKQNARLVAKAGLLKPK